jgi:energy-coupling factor transporter ATP-binding protein EcfA2
VACRLVPLQSGGMKSGGVETQEQLRDAVRSLRVLLNQTRFPLDATGAKQARAEASAIGQQLDDYVLPRLENLDAPALVVVGGSTGSGKSLLVSSIVGKVVSASGVIRPTTRSPVLVHHADDAAWFDEQRILPGLARVRDHRIAVDGSADDPRRELRLVTSDALPAGIALLDAPDIDSIDAVNRELAAQLLAAADVWVFVTTAARYADAVPWSFLSTARERGAPLILVLNRVPSGAAEELRSDLNRLLAQNGLADTPIFVIAEQALGSGELLGERALPVKTWLQELGEDHDRRADTVRRSLKGVFVDIQRRTETIADAADAQATLGCGLRQHADDHYAHALGVIEHEVEDGTIIRGEVLNRWEEFIGTGELLRQLRTGIGRLRSKLSGALTGRPVTQKQLNEAVENVLERLVISQADEAAAKTLDSWKASALGTSLRESTPASLGRSSTELSTKTATELRSWQGSLIDLVRDKGASRRTTARIASLGVNGVSAVLMMLVFSHTGGLTGGEVAIAGGASAVGHALLEALLGDDNLRRLATTARTDLISRVRALYSDEQARFAAVLDDAGIPENGGEDLRDLSATISQKLS